MESLPESKLLNLQNTIDVIGLLILKRYRMLEQSSSWNVTRDDSDLEVAAKSHAASLVNKFIPDSIASLEKRKVAVETEIAAYLRDNANDLVARAEAFEEQVRQEEAIIKRLSRDAKRGFTDQTVVDARRTALDALLERGKSDVAIQAGLKLLDEAKQNKTMQYETVRESEVLAEEANSQPSQETSRKQSTLPVLLDRLKKISDGVEHTSPDKSDLIEPQLKSISELDVNELSELQEQLLNDTEFVRKFSDSTGYQKVLTYTELHTVVAKVQEYITGQSDTGEYVPSLEFQKRIVKYASDYKGYSGNVSKSSLAKAQREISEQSASPMVISNLYALANTASLQLSKTIGSSERNFKIKVATKKGNWSLLPQAAFDLACYDVYRERFPTARDQNVTSWNFNKLEIGKWLEESKERIRELRLSDDLTALLAEFDSAMVQIEQSSVGEAASRKVSAMISLQLKAGHLVNDINKKVGILTTIEAMDDGEAEEAIWSCDIPSVMPQLMYLPSMHNHKYQPDNLVSTRVEQALAIDHLERTAEQQQLLTDINFLDKFTQHEDYKTVYTSSELHGLVAKLQVLMQKNRPDFNEVEDQILRVLLDKAIYFEGEISSSLKGMVDRADRDAPNRRGMKWDMLVDTAEQASSFTRERMKNFSDMGRYFIPLRDPRMEIYPNLTKVYQFVADTHALDVIGQRAGAAEVGRREAFVFNCEVINSWHDTVSHLLSYRGKDRELKKLTYQLTTMIETMNKRLEGGVSTGLNKDYKTDAAGAIGLQLKIGHTVEALKAYVNTSTPESDESTIVPLD